VFCARMITFRQAAVLILLLTNVVSAAATADTSPCKRGLPPISKSVTETELVKARTKMSDEGRCATYSHDFLEMVKARAILAACSNGTERNQEIAHLDSVIENINVRIASSCTSE
jgi:hypothetical protein